jgi:hypothetical protein
MLTEYGTTFCSSQPSFDAARLGATNKHAQDSARKFGAEAFFCKILWHYIWFSKENPAFTRSYGQKGLEIGGELTNSG